MKEKGIAKERKEGRKEEGIKKEGRTERKNEFRGENVFWL